MTAKKKRTGHATQHRRLVAAASAGLAGARHRFAAACRTLLRWLTTDVWDVEVTALPVLKRGLVRAVRVVMLVFRGFKQDECDLHASSLTFMTLLSFVPVFALAISVVRVVSYDASMRDQTKEFVRSLVIEAPAWEGSSRTNGVAATASKTNARPVRAAASAPDATDPAPDATDPAPVAGPERGEGGGMITLARIESLIDLGFDRVEQLNFGALGGIGLLFLIWAVISVLGRVEAAFNRVWGVVEDRPLARKFTDYLSVLIICPLLAFAASSLPIIGVLETKMSEFDRSFFISSMAGVPVIKVAWVLFLLTLAFTFLLRFTPNTRVNLRPGLVGGLVAAIGFAVWLKICLSLQIGVAKYSTFFGGFATVPIILSWVYVSWEILLFGAEVSYAMQNVDSYRMEQGWRDASRKSKILLAAALMREAAASLARGDGLLDLQAFNQRHRISARLVREVAHELVQCGLIIETATDSDQYALRCNPEALTLGSLVDVMLDAGVSPGGLGIAGLQTSVAVEQQLGAGLREALATGIGALPENIPPGGAR